MFLAPFSSQRSCLGHQQSAGYQIPPCRLILETSTCNHFHFHTLTFSHFFYFKNILSFQIRRPRWAPWAAACPSRTWARSSPASKFASLTRRPGRWGWGRGRKGRYASGRKSPGSWHISLKRLLLLVILAILTKKNPWAYRNVLSWVCQNSKLSLAKGFVL